MNTVEKEAEHNKVIDLFEKKLQFFQKKSVEEMLLVKVKTNTISEDEQAKLDKITKEYQEIEDAIKNADKKYLAIYQDQEAKKK